MGDPRRFHVFADALSERWPDCSLSIADVAAGKGYLRAALYQRGYRNVVCFDKRQRKIGRPYYRFQWFGPEVRNEFDLIVGMHPDEGTDAAMAYAIGHRLPFAVVPCCVKPNAWVFWGKHTYGEWMRHLSDRAEAEGYSVKEQPLAMNGRNLMLVGAVVTGTQP